MDDRLIFPFLPPVLSPSPAAPPWSCAETSPRLKAAAPSCTRRREERLHLGRPQQPAICLNNKERTDPKTVARQKDFACFALPNRKGKHAIESLYEFLYTPGQEPMYQYLRI